MRAAEARRINGRVSLLFRPQAGGEREPLQELGLDLGLSSPGGRGAREDAEFADPVKRRREGCRRAAACPP